MDKETKERRQKIWKDNKITLKEHKQFGEMCKVIHDKLVQAYCYKYTTIKDSDKSSERKAERLLSELKDYMERVLYGDYGDGKGATTHIYYGTNKWRESMKNKDN